MLILNILRLLVSQIEPTQSPLGHLSLLVGTPLVPVETADSSLPPYITAASLAWRGGNLVGRTRRTIPTGLRSLALSMLVCWESPWGVTGSFTLSPALPYSSTDALPENMSRYGPPATGSRRLNPNRGSTSVPNSRSTGAPSWMYTKA